MSERPILSPASHVALLKAGFERMQRSGEIASDIQPRDCVLEFPSVSPDHVMLIGFDMDGRARIKVELEVSDAGPEWDRWLLKYVRRKYGKTLRLMKE